MVKMKRYNAVTEYCELLGYFTSWEEAISALGRKESELIHQGFQVRPKSDVKFTAYNPTIRFEYYLIED